LNCTRLRLKKKKKGPCRAASLFLPSFDTTLSQRPQGTLFTNRLVLHLRHEVLNPPKPPLRTSCPTLPLTRANARIHKPCFGAVFRILHCSGNHHGGRLRAPLTNPQRAEPVASHVLYRDQQPRAMHPLPSPIHYNHIPHPSPFARIIG
jgi:hypothetical protein